MAKNEFIDVEEFLSAAKADGVKRIGVSVLMKNEDAGLVPVEKGKALPGRRITALLMLTGAARQDGGEDHYFYQRLIGDSVVVSEDDIGELDKLIEKERLASFKRIQEICPKALIFNGKVLV